MSLIDTSKQEKQLRKLTRRHERELSDIRAILMLPEGRRFYWKLMAAGSPFIDAFNSENSRLTDYALGRQSVSREFLNDLLEARPEAYAQMQKEREAESKADEQQEELERQQSGDLV